MGDKKTRPDAATRDAERAESEKQGGADRMPTDDEARIADERTLDPEVVEHEKEMAERGVNQKGEGRI